MRHILHGQKMMFSKKEKHTCTWGEEVGHPKPGFVAINAPVFQYIPP